MNGRFGKMDKYEFAELVCKTEDVVNSFKSENILHGDVIFFTIINHFRFGIKENSETGEKVLIIDKLNEKIFNKVLNDEAGEFELHYHGPNNSYRIAVTYKLGVLKIVSTNGKFSVWSMRSKDQYVDSK